MKDLEQKALKLLDMILLSTDQHTTSDPRTVKVRQGKWLQAAQQAKRKPSHRRVATLDGG